MENQYNYYNSDGMNGNGQIETPFHDDNGGQKHQAPHGKKPQRKFPSSGSDRICTIVWSCFQWYISGIKCCWK